MRLLIPIFGVLLLSFSAHSQFFLADEGHFFVDQSIKSRHLGIEIEFYGMSDNAILDSLKSHFNIKKIEKKGEGYWTLQAPFGVIELKVEGQAWRFEDNPEKMKEQMAIDLVEAPREIVFPPVYYSDGEKISSYIAKLPQMGAIGTSRSRAVSTQVNLEMIPLTQGQQHVDDLVNLMRIYYSPLHRNQRAELMNIPAKRKFYIGELTPGFMKKLMNSNYRPTDEQLFEDYMYRQSLEVLGDEKAWSYSSKQAREALLSRKDAVVPQVIKMVALRVSSLLMLAFPNDPLTKRVVEERWARPAPLVEFREFNTDFELQKWINASMGVARAAQRFGYYEHDKLFYEITSVTPADQARLRKELKKKNIVRYALQDQRREPFGPADYNWFKQMSPGSILLQLNPGETGSRPLRLAPGTVVWHRRHIHRNSILGEFNPGLENYFLQQVMENKLFEAMVLTEYAPFAVPKAMKLTDILHEENFSTDLLLKTLKINFPKGWVLKGAWDLASEKTIITDKLDLKAEEEKYQNGFEAFREKIEAENSGQDPEYVISELKKHPGYLGWKIHTILKQKDLCLVQERVAIATEMRVEIGGGKVLGKGSTIDRFGYMKKRPEPIDPKIVARAEAFAQKVIDALPGPLKVMPYGMDVALLTDGSFVVIETNPGGNSSFLEENYRSSRALTQYLKRYPKIFPTIKRFLLGETDQMSWISSHLEKYGMDAYRHYPGMKFTSKRLVDPDYPAEKASVKESANGPNKAISGFRRCKSALKSLLSFGR